jgi:uncharacterized protein YjbI with pentapeptide repeats
MKRRNFVRTGTLAAAGIILPMNCMKNKGEKTMNLEKLNEPINVRNGKIRGSVFEDLNMKDSKFTSIDLSNASFHDINFSGVSISAANLGGARFKHIGPAPDPKTGLHEKQAPVTFEEMMLCNSTFTRVDMSGVEIKDCNLEGMKINGILVTDLLSNRG